jgi:hypothetical protein
VTFDAADRSNCAVQRQSTSTPLQALVLLNDIQIAEAARHIAHRSFLKAPQGRQSQLAWIFETITSRAPSPRELPILERMLSEQQAHFTEQPDLAQKLLAIGDSEAFPPDSPADLAAFTIVALAVLNHDDAVHRR